MPTNAPMAAAPFLYHVDGSVAWGQMWQSFCALALDGGPPHRPALLLPVDPTSITDMNESAYHAVIAEITRGITETTGLAAQAAAPGWVAVPCVSLDMATWMTEAILAEGVTARSDGCHVLVPAGPAFALAGEIKSVITAVAKTHHYWVAHRIDPDAPPPVPEEPAVAAALAALRAMVLHPE